MAIIQDAITSLMGGDTVDDWQSQLRPCSFRGVPFAIISEEGVTDAVRQCMNTLTGIPPG